LEKEEITINLYTLNRKYQVKSLEKKYVVNFATIKGDSKDYILETIKNFLKNNSEKIKETQDYFDFNIEDGDYYLSISSDKVNEFEFVRNKMKAKSRLPALNKLTNKTTVLAIELIIEDNQYVFFQKVDISPRMKRKFTSMILKNGVFNKIVEPKSEELEFPPYFTFLYFEDSKEFLIFNKRKFEQSFDFRKFYKDNSEKAILNLEGKKFIFSKELKEGSLTQPRYMAKFTKILLCKGIENLEKRDLTPYEKEFGIKIQKDEKGNFLIKTEEDLDGLLKILQKECVVEVSTREKFFSKSKISVTNLLNKINPFK